MGSPDYPKAGIYVSGNDQAALSKPDSRGCLFVVTGVHVQWTAQLIFLGEDELLRNKWSLQGHPEKAFFIHEGSTLQEWQESSCTRTWTLRGDLGRVSDDISPPSTKFPSANFYQAVILKHPDVNDEGAPDTDTLIQETCGTELPKGPIMRQIELIRLYTGNQLYGQVNKALRDDDLEQMTYYGAFISELRDCFLTDHDYQIIKPFEGTVWRGISVDDPDTFVETHYQPKTNIVWSSFTSTSTNEQSCFGGDILFELRCHPPPGTYDDDDPEYAPANICEFSEYESENEVLFPPNVQFQVQYVFKRDDGGWKVVCNVNALETSGKDLVSFTGQKVGPRSILNGALDAMKLAVNRMDRSDETEERKPLEPKPSAKPARHEDQLCFWGPLPNSTLSELQKSSTTLSTKHLEEPSAKPSAKPSENLPSAQPALGEDELRMWGPLPRSKSGLEAYSKFLGNREACKDSLTKAGQGPTPLPAANVRCKSTHAGPIAHEVGEHSCSTSSSAGAVRSLRQQVEDARAAEAEAAVQARAWALLQTRAQAEAWLAKQAQAKFEAEARQAQSWQRAASPWVPGKSFASQTWARSPLGIGRHSRWGTFQ